MELYGVMIMVDQYGRKVEDKAIFDTCMRVYGDTTDLINETLIPALNDVLYGERNFPLKKRDQDVYERHAEEMSNVAYKYVAYSGVGKVPGRDLIAYPVETVTMDLKRHEFHMKVNVEKL